MKISAESVLKIIDMDRAEGPLETVEQAKGVGKALSGITRHPELCIIFAQLFVNRPKGGGPEWERRVRNEVDGVNVMEALRAAALADFPDGWKDTIREALA